MQRRLPPRMNGREQPVRREARRRFHVRQFTPESAEHVETEDEQPEDALLVVTRDAPEPEKKRASLLAGARAAQEGAKGREAELVAALAGADEDERVRIHAEIAKERDAQVRHAKEVEARSQPTTSVVSLMFRLRAGELNDAARLERAMLVPAEGEPIPLRFEGGRSGRAVTMTAVVKVKTTFYVALHLVGLAGAQVEVLLLGGGTIMSAPA